MSGEPRGSVVAFDPRVEESAPLLHAETVGRHDELHQTAHACADTDDEAALLEYLSPDRLFGRLAILEPAAREKDAVDRAHDGQAARAILKERVCARPEDRAPSGRPRPEMGNGPPVHL